MYVRYKLQVDCGVVNMAGTDSETTSGTPCPRHIIVPFGAEAPSGHVAQA